MKIKDQPGFHSKPAPITEKPDGIVLDAVKKMAEQNVGSDVVINEDRTVAGILTERDIFRRVVADQKDPATTQLHEVMSTNLRTANEDDNLLTWLRIMSNERFRRLPVVDENGRLTAIMSQGDFVSYTWPQLLDHAKTLVKSTISSGRQAFIVGGGILLYTTVLMLGLAYAIK
jgi:CBS domain-containing protein